MHCVFVIDGRHISILWVCRLCNLVLLLIATPPLCVCRLRLHDSAPLLHPGHTPELVFYQQVDGADTESEVERLDIRPYSLEQLTQIMTDRGFDYRPQQLEATIGSMHSEL